MQCLFDPVLVLIESLEKGVNKSQFGQIERSDSMIKHEYCVSSAVKHILINIHEIGRVSEKVV